MAKGTQAENRPSTASTARSARRQSPYDQIREAIVQGELGPGDPLVETALAATYNVSRTPIREALKRLEQDGLVQRGDRGLMVRERDPQEIFDIYETRIVLEALAARTAARRRTELDIAKLRMYAADFERAYERDLTVPAGTSELTQINREFHAALWQASHNESLADALRRLEVHLSRYPDTTLTAAGRQEAAIREHAELIDAIERRDADCAAELASIHFTESRNLRVRYWLHGAS